MKDAFENPRYRRYITLSDTVLDRHIAMELAGIGMNWGRVEYWLCEILRPLDEAASAEWVAAFFIDRNLGIKKKKILESMRARYPDLEGHLKDALKLLEDVCARRNVLVHGLWDREGTKSFHIQPLHITKGTLAPKIAVDLKFLVALSKDISRVVSKLAWIGAAVLSTDYLAKMEARSRIKR